MNREVLASPQRGVQRPGPENLEMFTQRCELAAEVETAKTLLELKADPTLRNGLGHTPLDTAVMVYGEVRGGLHARATREQ